MRTSRRGFLRALGLGAAATAVDHQAIVDQLTAPPREEPVPTAVPAASGWATNPFVVRAEYTDGVHRVGAWVPVSREVLEDSALDIRGFVDQQASRHLAERIATGLL